MCVQNPSHGLSFRYLEVFLGYKRHRMALFKVYICHKKKALCCGVRMGKPDEAILKMFTVRQNTLISPICKTK